MLPVTLSVLKPNTQCRRDSPTCTQFELVGDSLDESEEICQQQSQLHCVGGVNTRVCTVVTQFTISCADDDKTR